LCQSDDDEEDGEEEEMRRTGERRQEEEEEQETRSWSINCLISVDMEDHCRIRKNCH
jgi:hypothetical protein